MALETIEIKYLLKGISGVAIDNDGEIWQIEYNEHLGPVHAEKLKKTTGKNKGEYSIRIKDEQGRFKTYMSQWIVRNRIPYNFSLMPN
jgi:hypothetical protein